VWLWGVQGEADEKDTFVVRKGFRSRLPDGVSGSCLEV